MKGLLGRKVGMTQVFDEGVVVPVTVIEVGPCYVTQKKSQDVDGYSAIQVGFGEIKPKQLSKGELQHLKRHGIPALRYLREIRSAVADVRFASYAASCSGQKVKVRVRITS